MPWVGLQFVMVVFSGPNKTISVFRVTDLKILVREGTDNFFNFFSPENLKEI